MLKNDYFFSTVIRPRITSGSTPLDYLVGLKEALIYQGIEVSFGTLTCLPPITKQSGRLGFLPFTLGGALLAGHPCCHELFHLHMLRG
jgi:hypothetical protein